MIWVALLLGAGVIAWFLLAPRRFQTRIIATTEDPREVRPIIQEAAYHAGEITDPGEGGSSTPQPPS